MRIVILEDNEQRREVMKQVLAERFSACRIEFFVAAKPMIDHLTATGLHNVSLISLDNDLELIELPSGQLVDPGDGIEVSEWLSTRPAIVPIVVHTTNMIAGDRIMEVLGARGWIRKRVVPYDGEAWIFELWKTVVGNLLRQRDEGKVE